MSKRALFENLVTKRRGQRVADPNNSYSYYVIPHRSEKPQLILPFEYIKFELNGILRFIKMIEPEKVIQKHQEIKVASNKKVEEKPVEEKKPPEKVESKLDELTDRTKFEAYAQMQELAYEVHPVKNSQGFKDLNSMTKKQLVEFINDHRNLICRYSANSTQMPTVNELISIAIHGYTEEVDKDQMMFNTRGWAERFYKKNDIKKLLEDNGVEIKATWTTLKDLFPQIWDRGLLKKDPYMEDVPKKFRIQNAKYNKLKKENKAKIQRNRRSKT